MRHADKCGGQQVKVHHTSNLRRFTNNLGLLDLGYTGPAFIWTNNQATRFDIRERLDCAFSTPDWKIYIHKLGFFIYQEFPVIIVLYLLIYFLLLLVNLNYSCSKIVGQNIKISIHCSLNLGNKLSTHTLLSLSCKK